MIEGLPIEQFRSLPTQERAILFMERFFEFAGNHLTDPQDMRRVRNIAHQTVAIHTGKLSPVQRMAAETQIQLDKEAMLANPDSNVGRVACEYPSLSALYFGQEIRTEAA